MKPKILLRIAAGLALFFALGHSVGHFTRKDVPDTKAQEVIQMMTEHKFDMFGTMRSYDENYTGMSLNLIITLLALTMLLWLLSNLAEREPTGTRALLLPLLFCMIGFTVTSFLYFFMVPAITCLLASVFIALAAIRLKNR